MISCIWRWGVSAASISAILVSPTEMVCWSAGFQPVKLTRQRVSEALLIGDQLASAEGPEEMGQALASLPMLAVSLLDDGVDGHDIAAVISSQYRAALARAAGPGRNPYGCQRTRHPAPGLHRAHSWLGRAR